MFNVRSPQLSGYVRKLHVHPVFALLPFFLQRIIARVWLLSWLAPTWEERYLIILGSYLYKFKNESSTSLSGSPAYLASMEVHSINRGSMRIQDSEVSVALDKAPSGYSTLFVVSNGYKRQYYAAPSEEMARMWVTTLLQARQEAITRSMGHAAPESYPAAWDSFDRLGEDSLRRREKIRYKLQELSLRELEMSSLNESGPLPRGYYG